MPNTLPSITEAARLLGGEASGERISCPGPGHSHRDRSLSVRFVPSAPEGYVVQPHSPNDDWRACRDYVRERLGLASWRPSPRCAPGGPAALTRPAPSPSTVACDDAKARTRVALRFWHETVPIAGALAECYLVEHRKLDVRRRLTLDHCLRWHVGLQAVVALMTDPVSGKPIGVHRTFLDADGAKVERKMLGRQGVVCLSPDGAVTAALGISEGVEDGLAVLLSGWSPVWAATSAGAIARFPLLAGIEALTIFADADQAGQRAAEICAERWLADGRDVRIAAPGRSA